MPNLRSVFDSLRDAAGRVQDDIKGKKRKKKKKSTKLGSYNKYKRRGYEKMLEGADDY